MDYETALQNIQNENFCDPVKSENLSSDLTILKTQVLPALMGRIADMEKALQRDSEKLFDMKSSRDEL